MTQHPSFGGPWTDEKLEILSRYLDFYTTALKRFSFELTYIDAFAGSGSYQTEAPASDDAYQDFDGLRQGSAQIALAITNKPFDRLIYIEKNPEFVASLNTIRDARPNRRIEVIEGDANEQLPKVCEAMRPNERAVMFLDPYKTEVNWPTVESIAKTEKVDCWILFPLMALTRMMDRDERPSQSLAVELDRVFGGRQFWEGEMYRPAQQQSLFSGEELVARESQDRIAQLYRGRLATIFAGIAPTRRVLRNSQNSPLFELMFAVASPNPRAKGLAIRTAEHILKNW